MNEENRNEYQEGDQENGEGLATGRPAVAAAPGKVFAVIIIAIVLGGLIIKSLFFGAPKKHVEEKSTRKETVSAPMAPTDANLPFNISQQANIPPPPTGTANNMLPPPPPPQETLTPPVPPDIPVKTVNNEQVAKRTKAPMIVGGGSGLKSALSEKKKLPNTDPNNAFAQSIAESKAESVEATQVKNLGRTLMQGKFVEAVLETAIDSDLPGDVRAIVSHDVYAESGRSILIPKGSRLVGVYNSSVKRGQARVFVIWTRVMRPDGVDVAINSPGIDGLGRAGAGGEVDNKYFEAFSTALLTSALDIGVAAAGQGLFGDQQQTTTSGPNGGSTTTSSPTATAMQNAVQNVGTVGQAIVNSAVNLAPTIHVDQGSMINVFVNKDVVFPYDVTNGAGFIP